MKKQRIIIGITGASGAIYGIRLLEMLKDSEIETHLIISKAAHITIPFETDFTIKDVQALATHTHNVSDIAACISSGSYHTLGMIVAPCSVKTLAEIATGISSNLLSRSADVVMKERKKLVLMVRETPLHTIHLRNMTALSEMGVIIAPPVPAFYNQPTDIADQVNHTCGRILDLFDIGDHVVKRWQGIER
jgi:4-hydroxy-3-polyprenylbenzoate decarboxylase